MAKDWKQLLLKSGLPFEYAVAEHFVKSGCLVWGEYQYSRPDETGKEKDFSYDIDANYWNGCSIDLMVECKYKTQPTKWFFLPDAYGYQNEADPDGFFHVGDQFVHKKFQFARGQLLDKKYLAPLCLKGVEIFENDYLETNIFKAINQLSYAFVDKLIGSFNEQLHTETFYDTAFVHVPVIVTNADLYLINKRTTISQIENASDITEVAEKHPFLVFRNKANGDLKRYNGKKLNDYFESIDKQRAIQYLNYHFQFEQFLEDMSELPGYILVMNHSESSNNYEILLNYIRQLIAEKHPEAIKRRSPPANYITELDNQLKEILKRKGDQKNR
ncbi:hypothetical protein RT717_15760 [Imperialibacter roseus]|uniref:DUF4263 domain-containing protein n=1 Tax=Imperialibacter roseus TaxID=1324217 RepID=A0ABZ0ILU5_9BACT|nr:hypothetical protein [Imperialibacter roseus]WOK04537.1 hypothetical protein RT717_15760 [Imperialibacter roseus]